VSLAPDGLIPVQFTFADHSGLNDHTEFVVWCATVPRLGEMVRSATGPKEVRGVLHEPVRTPDGDWVMSVSVLLTDPAANEATNAPHSP
jgi:hypothetical protein